MRTLKRTLIFVVILVLLFALAIAIEMRGRTTTNVTEETVIDISETETEIQETISTAPETTAPVTEEQSGTAVTAEQASTECETETPSEELIFEYQEEVEDGAQEEGWALYSPSYFRTMGMIEWGDWTWTWYSERVLPGEGLHIPGRYTDSQGYVRDEDGYLCLASSALDHGTVVDTPFGSPGKVYDSGCDYYILDVYVGW